MEVFEKTIELKKNVEVVVSEFESNDSRDSSSGDSGSGGSSSYCCRSDSINSDIDKTVKLVCVTPKLFLRKFILVPPSALWDVYFR